MRSAAVACMKLNLKCKGVPVSKLLMLSLTQVTLDAQNTKVSVLPALLHHLEASTGGTAAAGTGDTLSHHNICVCVRLSCECVCVCEWWGTSTAAAF